MREIKFRAWYQKEMYHWENNMGAILKFLPRPDIWIGVEVMQFTGLKDKNGKEIYEGDVVKIKTDRCEGNALIIFDYCEFSCKELGKGLIEEFESLGNFRFKDSNIQVIGNIYENPELLEEGK